MSVCLYFVMKKNSGFSETTTNHLGVSVIRVFKMNVVKINVVKMNVE